MARLDTGWHVNPKVLKVGLAGMGLHAWSISYCDHALSDGFIPNGAWPALAGVRGAVMALVRAGLWVPVDDGFRLHDYTDYNRTRAQVQEEQEGKHDARVRAGRAGGLASGLSRSKTEANVKQTAKQNGSTDPSKTQAKRSPGPGPGINSISSRQQQQQPEHARAPARDEPDPQLLAEHLRRVEQERQTAAAAPAYVNFSEETLA